MESDFSPQGSVQPMSVGNIVNAGLQLYRSHFQQYFQVALMATLWILLPLALAIPIILFFAVVQNYYALLALIIPAWIVLFVYCLAKYMADSAAISRLAFGELTQQLETSEQAKRFTNSRKWWFWVVTLLVSLIYSGISLGFYIVLFVLLALAFVVAGGGDFQFGVSTPEAFLQDISANPAFWGVAVIGFLALIIAFLVLFSWFSARLSVAEIPLAIESETSATRSVGRSWNLTRKNAWRVFAVLLITALITIPLQVLIQIISSLVDRIIATLLPAESAGYTALSLVMNYIFSLAISVLLVPLWQTIKAVIYYDLRNRREGLGLHLRDQTDR